MTMTQFSKFSLNSVILEALTKKGYESPTEIQELAIGEVLSKKDLLAIAQTGTGKTAAFSIPLIQFLIDTKKKVTPFRTRILVLCPTRELAEQVHDSFRDYGKGLAQKLVLITGGGVKKKQADTLMKGAEVVIATPGRILDLIKSEKLFLDELETLVLDEADRMLDMGFIEDITKIIEESKSSPVKRQTLLFSATMKEEIESLAQNILSEPVRIEVEKQGSVTPDIEQSIYWVHPKLKDKSLQSILKRKSVKKAIVFVRTKKSADRLSDFLNKVQLKHTVIHGDKTQGERDYALRHFKKGQVSILIASDVAARGIDIDDISHVINYTLPDNPEHYIHRIGRTGRAGSQGRAISLCDESDRSRIAAIEELLSDKIPVDEDHKFHGKMP
jgi:ATP-dependent RNA helicase RhlE